jgi:hypothetical protein
MLERPRVDIAMRVSRTWPAALMMDQGVTPSRTSTVG